MGKKCIFQKKKNHTIYKYVKNSREHNLDESGKWDYLNIFGLI